MNTEKIDLKNKILIPGIVDMRVFVGEPGFEYKENFRTLSNAALSWRSNFSCFNAKYIYPLLIMFLW